MASKLHSVDRFVERIQDSTDFYLILPLLGLFAGLVRKLLVEKENRIKEGMKMMGMTNFSFYMSWVLTYFLMMLIITLVITYIVAV